MTDIFSQLAEQHSFVDIVTAQYNNAPCEISDHMTCEIDLDPERINYAYNEYKQNIEKFALLLHSSNPDHYKRSGALLHALYGSRIIESVAPNYTVEDISNGISLIHPHDTGELVPFLEFYQEYHNQMHAFDLAYQVCAAYEDEPVPYDFDYLHNVCHFMKKNNNLSLDTFFMMFKSLMYKGEK